MIPKIFVSSTIKDLHYLRDAVRDAILEIGYEAVMSEYGGVGYMRPETAASSCQYSIKNCEIAVFFLGSRYNAETDGLSATHKEYRAAVERNIPRITFVEPKLLTLFELYTHKPDADWWKDVPDIDNAPRLFALLKEIKSDTAFNGLIPFNGVIDAKQGLKSQLAHMMGELLLGQVSPARAELQEILAELKTIRENITKTDRGDQKPDEAKVYLNTARNLLKDRFKEYYGFLTAAYRGDSDSAIKFAAKASDLMKLQPVDGFKLIIGPVPRLDTTEPPQRWGDDDLGRGYHGHFSMNGNWEVFEKGCRIEEEAFHRFDKLQREIFGENQLMLGVEGVGENSLPE